jgi:hypothetical protein
LKLEAKFNNFDKKNMQGRGRGKEYRAMASIIVLICKEMRKVEGGNKRKLYERKLSVPNLI